eukprot:4233024-Prymnesium_polylepis.1
MLRYPLHTSPYLQETGPCASGSVPNDRMKGGGTFDISRPSPTADPIMTPPCDWLPAGCYHVTGCHQTAGRGVTARHCSAREGKAVDLKCK